jgi:hypothetical protein
MVKITEQIKEVDVTITLTKREFGLLETIFSNVAEDPEWSPQYVRICQDLLELKIDKEYV